MTDTLAAVPRTPLLRTALHRFADRLGLAAKTRPRAPVPDRIDVRALHRLSDHLLRDIGFVREPAARARSSFPCI